MSSGAMVAISVWAGANGRGQVLAENPIIGISTRYARTPPAHMIEAIRVR